MKLDRTSPRGAADEAHAASERRAPERSEVPATALPGTERDRYLREVALEHLPLGVAVYDTSDDFVCLAHNSYYRRLTNRESPRPLVGLPLRSFLAEETYPAVKQIYEHVRDTGAVFDTAEYEATLRGEESPRYYRWTLSRTDAGAGPPVLVVAISEMTEQVRARRRIERIAALTHAALAGRSLAAIRRDAAELVEVATGAELVAILTRRRDGRLVVAAGSGWQPEWLGAALDDEDVLFRRFADPATGATQASAGSELPPLLARHEARSALVVPIGAAANEGAVLAASRRARSFSDSERNLLHHVADLISVAAARQRAERRAGRHAEKLREARDQLAAILDGVAAGIMVEDDSRRVVFANQAGAAMAGHATVRELVRASRASGEPPPPIGGPLAPPDPPGLRAFAGEAAPEATVRFPGTDGDEIRLAHVKARPLFDKSGRVRLAVNIVEDITDQARSQEELAARAAEQATIAELGQRALSGVGLQMLMSEAVERLCAGLGVEHAQVIELLPDGQGLAVKAAVGWPVDVAGMPVAGGRGSQAGYTLLTGKPVVSADLAADERFARHPLLAEHGVQSAMSVIIGDRSDPYGVLSVHSRARREFSEEEVHFLQSVANLIATAITRVRAEELAARQARIVEESRFEERTNIAREIHDGLVQEIWLARLKQGLLAERESLGESERALANELGAALDSALRSARQAVMAMRSSDRESRRLGDTLVRYVGEVSTRLGLTTEVVTHGQVPLVDAGVQREILAVVREALTNVSKHARTSRVRVEATVIDSALHVSVRDDGRGFRAGAAGGGFGIRGMRERAALVGAALDIRTTPGGGTAVGLVIPLPRLAGRA